MTGVQRHVGDRDAGAHHGALVADRVDAVQQVRPLVGVAHVEPVHALVGLRVGRVGLRDHRVDPHDLVAALGEHRGDLAADEAGRRR